VPTERTASQFLTDVSSNLVFNDKATESVAKIDLGKSTRRIDVGKGANEEKVKFTFFSQIARLRSHLHKQRHR